MSSLKSGVHVMLDVASTVDCVQLLARGLRLEQLTQHVLLVVEEDAVALQRVPHTHETLL